MEVDAAAPSPTIYLSNIDEKVKKEVLKRSLYELYSGFGVILDIVIFTGN